MKVALAIGNCALGSYCLAATQANHCSELCSCMSKCPIPNDQYYCQRNLYSWLAATSPEGHVNVDTINTFFVALAMKMEFSCQRGEKCFCSWP